MEFIYDHDRLWLSHRDPAIKNAKEPWYYDDDFDFKYKVETAFPVIKEEIISALSSGKAESNTVITDNLASGQNTWQGFAFFFWNDVVNENNSRLCPRTVEILRSIDGCISASVSVLQGNSAINIHRGNTNAIYRCHLPLVVPAALPTTGFYVGYEERSWEEGKLLVFNDAAYHKAWNNSHDARIVLIFDVVRPCFRDKTSEICREVLEYFREKGLNG